MKKQFAAGTLAVALAVGGLLFASPAMATDGEGPATQGNGQPEFICDETGDGWQDKEDTTENPATVTVNAPDGSLIDAYCVKAGTEGTVINVEPSASVVIDHPTRDSVSHYQVHLIPVVVTDPEGPALPIDLCHGYGTADASIVTVTTEAEFQEHAVVHKDAPMSAENCNASKPAPPVEVCHGYGTPEASLIVLDSPEAFEEHAVVHKDAPMSAENCEASKPVVVEPAVCVASGDWYSEDGGDVSLTPEGVVFTATGSTPGIDYRRQATGNLQGWESLSYVATGATDQFYVRLTIDAHADGGKSYQSLSFPGYTTVDQSSVAYQTGKSIAEMAELWPNAVITSVGFSMNSGAAEGATVTLSSMVSDCGSVDFTFTPVDPVVPVTLADPQVFDLCGTDDDDIAFPADTEGVHYAWKSEDPASPAYWTLRAWIAEGYEVQGPLGDWTAFDGGYELSFAMTDEPCTVTPTPEPTPEPTVPAGNGDVKTPAKTAATSDTLAITGSDMNMMLPIAGGAAVMLGLTLTLLRRFARN